jgi:hypothetical protein
MTAGDESLKRVRVIRASDDETIEIEWWRSRWPEGSQHVDTQIIRMRYTAPPAEVWAAKLKAEQDKKDPT